MTQTEILFDRYGSNYQWLLVLTVVLGLVALGMSITIVNVAIPYIKGAFGMSDDQVQWLSTGFLAATTVALLVAPWLVSSFGQRATYIGLLVVFIGASLLGGMATSMAAIITARIIQGAMTGLIRPLAMDALFAVFPTNQRGMATAMYGMSLVLPLTLATVIGGWLVDTYSWRYVFFIVPPICIAAIVMGYYFLPPREGSGPLPVFDWFGACSLFISIFAMLAAVSNGQRWGWDSNGIVALIGLSLVVGVIFVLWEQHVKKPLLDLAIFANGGFLMGSITLFLFGGAFYAIMYLLPNFMQGVLHYDPVTVGMLFTPSTLVLAILVPVSGKLSDRMKPHHLTLPGLAFAVYAVYRMAHVDWHTSFESLAISMMLLSVGMALFPPPTLSRAIASLPERLSGYGSGAINFAMQLGGAFGTAGLVTLMDRRSLFHSDNLTAGLTPGNPVAMHALAQLQAAAASVGVNPMYQHAAALRALATLDETWTSIFVYQDGFWIVTVAIAIIAVPSWLLSRWTSSEDIGAATSTARG